MYHVLWQTVDALLPPQCAGCGQAGVRWCDACEQAVERLMPPLCEVCGDRLSAPGRCVPCRRSLPAFDGLRSWAVFGGPVRHALHRLKYRRDLGTAEVLAERLADCVTRWGVAVDWVVPVPLSRARYRARGYNQAAMLARPLAWLLQRPFRPQVLERVVETRSQVGLNREQRRRNVQGAFRAQAAVQGRRILLVDDVATSGATLDAAAQALKHAGAGAVFAVTVARAVLSDGGSP